MNIEGDDFRAISLKLAQMLKVLDNDIWIYSADLDSSKRAYEILKSKGYDQKITLLEAPIPPTQIDIVVHP